MASDYFEYDCPQCDEHIEIKKVTPLPKRNCANCGYPIKLEEIQRQAADRKAESRRKAEKMRGMIRILVGGAVVLVLVFLGVQYLPAGIKYFFPESEKVEAPKPLENPNKNVALVPENKKDIPEASLKKDVEPKVEFVDVEPREVPDPNLKKKTEPLVKIDPIQEEIKKKERLETDLNFRLTAIKSFVRGGKPDEAMRYARDLIRLYPDSRQAHEAKGIIEDIERNQ